MFIIGWLAKKNILSAYYKNIYKHDEWNIYLPLIIAMMLNLPQIHFLYAGSQTTLER